jgi:thiol-disulfide isomerase/thioredoxin
MDREEAYAALIDAEVVVEDKDGVSLGDAFAEAWNEAVAGLPTDGSGLVDAVTPHATGVDPDWLVDVCAGDPDRIGGLVAVSETYPDRPLAERLRLLLAVERLRRDPPRADGSPTAFLPVYPDQLPLFLHLAHKTVVYVWREDCPPCDTMVEEFDDKFPEPPDDLALLSVYGPADPVFLHERYDVGGGPVTLLTVDGEVDLRLNGAHYRRVIDGEIATLRETEG